MLRLPLVGLSEGEQRLNAEASRYLSRVHRLAPGDAFVAFDPEARLEAPGRVVRTGPPCVVWLEAPRAATRVAGREVQVIQALPKGGKIDAIVRDATELGATRLTVARSLRSVRQTVDLARLRRIAIEAARQCGRGDLPAIEGVVPLEHALRDCDAVHRIALDASGGVFAEAVGARSVALLIGPEGGLSREELSAASASGFTLTRLGAFTMRSETVCAAALGALAALSGGTADRSG